MSILDLYNLLGYLRGVEHILGMSIYGGLIKYIEGELRSYYYSEANDMLPSSKSARVLEYEGLLAGLGDRFNSGLINVEEFKDGVEGLRREYSEDLRVYLDFDKYIYKHMGEVFIGEEKTKEVISLIKK